MRDAKCGMNEVRKKEREADRKKKSGRKRTAQTQSNSITAWKKQ